MKPQVTGPSPMRFDYEQGAGRQESENKKIYELQIRKNAVLILSVNINRGGKRVRRLR